MLYYVIMVDWILFQTVGHYFPLQAGSLTFGPFTVDMVTVDESNESYTVRDFTITSSKRVSVLGLFSAFFKRLF